MADTIFITNRPVKGVVCKDNLPLAISKADNLEYIFADFETTGLNPREHKPLLLSFFDYDEDIVYVVDCRAYDLTTMFRYLKDKIWVFHNAKFDALFVKYHYDITLENLRCTMQMNRLLYNNDLEDMSYYSLESITHRWFGAKMNKSVRFQFIGLTDIIPFTKEMIEYAAEDVIYMPRIYKFCFNELKKLSQEHLLGIESKFLPRSIEMEYYGFTLDVKAWRRVTEYNRQKLKKLTEEMKKCLLKLSDHYTEILSDRFDGYIPKHLTKKDLKSQGTLFGGLPKDVVVNNFNPASPMQVKEVFSRAGFNISGTGDAVLRLFKKENPEEPINEFIDLLIGKSDFDDEESIRGITRSLNSYGDKFIKKHVKSDGKIHTSFSEVFTTTGRLSSKNPNVQNIPRLAVYREAFVAEPGYRIVTADYSGCELRICAYQSQSPVLLDAVNKGGDIHAIMATTSYRIIMDDPEFEVSKKKNKHLRTKHKPVLFGLLYGAGVSRISEVLDIQFETAKKVYDALRGRLPKLFKYLEESGRFACTHNYIYANDITNRRKYFKDEDKPFHKRIKEAKNYRLQATNADIIKEAIIECHKLIVERGWDNVKILSTVHDEIIFQVPEDNGLAIGKELARKMEEVGEKYTPGVQMICDINMITNENGQYVLPKTWTK